MIYAIQLLAFGHAVFPGIERIYYDWPKVAEFIIVKHGQSTTVPMADVQDALGGRQGISARQFATYLWEAVKEYGPGNAIGVPPRNPHRGSLLLLMEETA